jgi:hypothetical protein
MAVTLIGNVMFPSLAYWATPNVRARVIILRIILDLSVSIITSLKLLWKGNTYDLS